MIVSGFDASAPTESLALTEKENVPGAVGVPEMAPSAFIDTPSGRLPDSTDQVYGGIPPDALTDVE